MTDIDVDWAEFTRKASQLEAEIHKSTANAAQRADMLHTVSKMRIAASNIVDGARRAESRSSRQDGGGDGR